MAGRDELAPAVAAAFRGAVGGEWYRRAVDLVLECESDPALDETLSLILYDPPAGWAVEELGPMVTVGQLSRLEELEPKPRTLPELIRAVRRRIGETLS